MHTAPLLPELAGVRHRWVDAAGLRVHCAEYGAADLAAPVVVLQHGWPQHWYAWRHVLPLLPDGVRVLMPDLRGAGWTAAPRGGYHKEQLAHDLVAVLDTLGIEAATLVGHDWGGWVTQLVSLRWPHRVRAQLALSILPPVPGLRLRLADLRRFAYQPALATPVLAPLALRAAPELVTRLTRSAAHPGFRWDEEALQSYADVLADIDRTRASSRLYRSFLVRDVPRVQRGRYAAAPSVPTRLMIGSHDPVVPPRFVPAGDRDVVTVPHAGHFLPEEAPAAVAKAVRDLLHA